MNQAAKKVSDSLLSSDYKTIIIANKAYTVYPPTIKTICKIISHFSCVKDVYEGLEDIELSRKELVNGISCFICSDESLSEELSNGTWNELKNVMDELIPLLTPDDFFVCAALARNVAAMAAQMQ